MPAVLKIRLHGATLVETVVALLILMISFSAGMVIYGKLMQQGMSMQQLRAELEAAGIADSLSREAEPAAQQIIRQGMRFQVDYRLQQRSSGLLQMRVEAFDGQGRSLAREEILILKDEKQQD